MILSNIPLSKRLLFLPAICLLYIEQKQDINFQKERRCPYVSEYIRASFKTVL
jgi:hypothetical protein